ncbi:hypothetical protein ON010_g1670 [Phytophthora cinnamomi]|nr:hypothetical protein ON010_g1670 [Phytophthora cinnamomi]
MVTLDEHADDESFLADLTGFLNTLQPPVELQAQERSATEETDLLLDSDKLLAETEALLANANAITEEPRDRERQVTTSGFYDEERLALEKQRLEHKNKLAAKRRLKYRNKLKSERETLLEQEKALSEELDQLQHARKKAKSRQEDRISHPLWKGVAARQMEGRSVAEHQQQTLKGAVATRQKVILEVGEMVRQQLCGLRSPPVRVDVNLTEDARGGQLEADDIVLFEDYLQDIDEVYAQTDEAFRDCGLQKDPQVPYKVGPVWKHDGKAEYLETLDVELVPHGFEQTCTAMWQAMTQVHERPGRQQYRGVTDPDNTIAVKLRLPCLKDSGEPVDMLIHLVNRRYIEVERMVIVWRAMTEGQDEFSGMHSDEYGWCIVRQNAAETGGDTTMPTVIETFARFIPMKLPTQRYDKVHADQFAKFVVSSGEDDGAEISRMMETLLLDDSVS